MAIVTLACTARAAPAARAPEPTAPPIFFPTGTPTEAIVPSPPPTPTVSKLATPTDSPVTPTIGALPTASGQLKLDMDAIFPPGKGRDLVLSTCTACHSFVRIVLAQRTEERWAVVKRNHRSRVPLLGDQDFETLFAYLAASFNDSRPVPELPDWFLATDSW